MRFKLECAVPTNEFVLKAVKAKNRKTPCQGLWEVCCTRLVLYMALHLWNFVWRHVSFCSECGFVRAGVIRRAKYWIICVLLTTGQAVTLEFRTLSEECQTLMQPWDAVSRLHKARPPYNRRCQIHWTDFLLCVRVNYCGPIVILWTLVCKQALGNILSMEGKR